MTPTALYRIVPVADRTAHSDGRVYLFLGKDWVGTKLVPVFWDLVAGLMLFVENEVPKPQAMDNLHGVISQPKTVDVQGRLWWKNGVRDLGLSRARFCAVRRFGPWVVVELGAEYGPTFAPKQDTLFSTPDLQEADRSDTRPQLELPLFSLPA